MKQLNEALKLQGDHVVIDCCPNQNPESPVSHPIMDELYDKSPLGHYRPERKGHTLYANIGILIGIVWDQASPIEVLCRKCGSKYVLTKDLIDNLYDQIKRGQSRA